MDESLLQKWSHDPLMDHKHLVLMVFEQDKVTGRPSFTHKENLPNSTLQEKKTFPEFSTEKVEIEKTYLRCDSKSLKGVQQVSKLHRLEENIQQVPHISPSGFALNDSISEAAMLFTNFFNDTKKQSKKKVFKTGPDPTQLSSVLLELRDEVMFHMYEQWKARPFAYYVKDLPEMCIHVNCHLNWMSVSSYLHLRNVHNIKVELLVTP